MSASEPVLIVDDWNRPVATVTRREMRAHKLAHRATYILVFDDEQRLCVQHRSLAKDYCPGWLDAAAGGVVTSGESYALSAERELQEELGIRAPLTVLDDFYTQGEDGGRAWGRIYVCHWPRARHHEVQAQAEEISALEWLHVDELKARDQTGQRVTPDSLLAVDIALGKPRAPICEPGVVLCDTRRRDDTLILIERSKAELLGDTLWLVRWRGTSELISENVLRSFWRDGDNVRARFAVV